MYYRLQPFRGGEGTETYGGLAFLPEGVAKLLDVVYDMKAEKLRKGPGRLFPAQSCMWSVQLFSLQLVSVFYNNVKWTMIFVYM